MVQQHIRWSPHTCSCVLDLLIDDQTGNQSLFCIRNLCDVHAVVATPDPDFETKKAAALTERYRQLDENRDRNYAQIDAYTDLQMSPSDKAACKANVDRITAERKTEYDILTNSSNLVFCANVHNTVSDENTRVGKVYQRVQTQYALTDAQMQTITWSYSGTAPNRLFTVNFYSLITQTQKNNLQTWCNTNLGLGKVTVL